MNGPLRCTMCDGPINPRRYITVVAHNEGRDREFHICENSRCVVRYMDAAGFVSAHGIGHRA